MEKSKQYIGPYEIFALVEEEMKTPAGSDVVKVLFTEGKPPMLMPKKALELFMRPSPMDLTTFQEMKFNVMIPEIIKVIGEYDIKMGEIPALMQKLSNTMFDNYDRASIYLWTGDDKNFIPGFNASHERTLLETEKVLKSIPQNDSNNATNKKSEK